MENLNANKEPIFFLQDMAKKISEVSYRGFISIDQEMEREIAMNFFTPEKKTVVCQKGFVFIPQNH